ncbi:MAG: zinc ribbon domain-containing protein [Deltaproteobacteria bacterium]|nr:zinc ribbon domain-containing protein [Deltaproteobacteria bacterium]MBW2600664.1 zinc ribbon domain-containing protein [Deltaproteobacteria bacterium]
MPIFEYHCTKCNKDFEVLVFGKEKPACPYCKGKKIARLLSTVSHKSGGEFTSSQGSSCTSCNATSCSSCGH